MRLLLKVVVAIALLFSGAFVAIAAGQWFAGETDHLLAHSIYAPEVVRPSVGRLLRVGASVLVVALVVWGAAWAWWQLSIPRRATVVLTKLVATGEEAEDRPRLRRAWKRGSVWRLAWSMPVGGTVAKVQSNRAALEESLDCGVRVWFDRGLLHGEFGVARLPERVGYQEFTSRPLRSVAAMHLPMPLGSSRQGPLWVDLSGLPHLLVGGTTNFGKSGFLRQLLATLTVRLDPEHLGLLLADLKSGVEFNVFGDLPHLWHPLMTDLASCEAGLSRASVELDRRLALLRSARVENIARFNAANASHPLPYLVVVVDEVGELRPGDTLDKEERGARQRVVALLIRIGRLGRAAGVHLICATQRPDAETVGGQLKAQLPATLAFFCRDDVNSRILLDNSAASDLPPKPGRAIWQHGADQVQLQVPHLELAEAEVCVSGVIHAWRAAQALDRALVPSSSGEHVA